jgi:ribosomal protein S6--L-glutamate ligase
LQKLAPSERFLLPARAALAAGVTPWGLGAGIAAALRYDHPDDAEAVQLQRWMKEEGPERTLVKTTGLRQTDLLGQIVLSQLPRREAARRPPARLAPASHVAPASTHPDAIRVHFLLAGRVPPVPSPVLVEVYERLRARGVTVDDCIPEEVLVCTGEFAVRHELYVLKSHTELALSMAGMLNALGARLLNPYRSCLLTQDKVTSTKLLGDAGVPVPPSWVTDDYDLVRPFLARGPLIAKPHRGHRGSCVRVLRGPEDLASLCPTEGPFLFQQYLESDGEDLKAYVVGERAFAVTKPFSPDAFQYFGCPVELDARARDIVLTCGRVLGLHLYGVDLVVTDDGPFVVDVNYFPGFKGVPGAAQLIADYVHEYGSNRVPAGHVGEGAG